MKLGLALEGGANRGNFSVGAMDVLMEHEIWADYVIGTSAGIANGVSYALGMVCSFLLNKRWTFNAGSGRWRREACFFFGGSVLCWCVQWAFFRLSLRFVPEIVAQLGGMAVYTLLGFVFNKKITFRPPLK